MNAIEASGRTSIEVRELAKRGAAAIALSVVGNLLLLWIVLAGDFVEPYESLSVTDVSLFTALGALGATLVYGALTRFSDTPDRTFTIVAAVVLVLSFLPDVALLEFDDEATVPAVIVLMIMHVVAASICVAVLTDRFSPRSR